jgi:hypothetical protein
VLRKVALFWSVACVFAQSTQAQIPTPTGQTALIEYEIRRAQARLRDYVPEGQSLNIIEQQTRLLSGTRGSTLTVYCGRTQSREEHVVISPFYYVLDVQPAGSLLSDYERGSWSISAEGVADTEYTKLCLNSSSGLDDIVMLRSATHTSSGSIFRPYVNDTGLADRNWLIGAWVTTDSCATQLDHEFRIDGRYAGADTAGRWSLFGDTVRVEITEEFTDEGDGAAAIISPPQVSHLRITRTGIDTMRVVAGTADPYDMIRC